jgi:hypothetical protein
MEMYFPFGNNGSNVTASWKSIKSAYFANPLLYTNSPIQVPVWWSSTKLTDVRIIT